SAAPASLDTRGSALVANLRISPGLQRGSGRRVDTNPGLRSELLPAYNQPRCREHHLGYAVVHPSPTIVRYQWPTWAGPGLLITIHDATDTLTAPRSRKHPHPAGSCR